MSSARTVTLDREQTRTRLHEAREHTDRLFGALTRDALFSRPIPERHRLIFYLGHLEAFDWNLIARGGFDVDAFHAEWDRLFAFGIDPVDGGLPTDPPSEWPDREKILDYNRRARAGIDACLERAELGDPNQGHGRLFQVAIEHRLMHEETLAYLLHQVPYDGKSLPEGAAPPSGGGDPGEQTVRIPPGRATLGMERDAGVFGWDNEFGRLVVEVPSFEIDVHDVTNGRFLEFLEAGGYENRALWSDADWAWKEQVALAHPGFWRRQDGRWRYRGMTRETELPLDAPVYVSHAEASAYARWKGRRLPTEAEFHRAAYGTPTGEERDYPWGDEEPRASRGNFDFQRWDPVAVGSFPEGSSAFGVHDLLGNGWEWTETPFAALPGFEPFPFYPGYSADFFDGNHFVMKGGSPRTAAGMVRRTFRNWFQSHYSYMYATFRLVTR